MQKVPVIDAQGNPTGVYRYEGTVANRALELLGKELGMFIERKEITRKSEWDEIDDADELRRRLLEYAAEIGEDELAMKLIDAKPEGEA